MNDDDVRMAAEVYICDYIWCLRKLSRGELYAVQRVLYQDLMETTLRLMHELRRRNGERTYTKARRLEKVLASKELAAFTIKAGPVAAELSAAMEQNAEILKQLVRDLVGTTWSWPRVS